MTIASTHASRFAIRVHASARNDGMKTSTVPTMNINKHFSLARTHDTLTPTPRGPSHATPVCPSIHTNDDAGVCVARMCVSVPYVWGVQSARACTLETFHFYPNRTARTLERQAQ